MCFYVHILLHTTISRGKKQPTKSFTYFLRNLPFSLLTTNISVVFLITLVVFHSLIYLWYNSCTKACEQFYELYYWLLLIRYTICSTHSRSIVILWYDLGLLQVNIMWLKYPSKLFLFPYHIRYRLYLSKGVLYILANLGLQNHRY